MECQRFLSRNMLWNLRIPVCDSSLHKQEFRKSCVSGSHRNYRILVCEVGSYTEKLCVCGSHTRYLRDNPVGMSATRTQHTHTTDTHTHTNQTTYTIGVWEFEQKFHIHGAAEIMRSNLLSDTRHTHNTHTTHTHNTHTHTNHTTSALGVCAFEKNYFREFGVSGHAEIVQNNLFSELQTSSPHTQQFENSCVYGGNTQCVVMCDLNSIDVNQELRFNSHSTRQEWSVNCLCMLICRL